uniref:Uroplakin 3B n=1 Tax=Nomascus leucogenys TaxID=61853 RepID=A0A2I3GSR0_NOMLE
APELISYVPQLSNDTLAGRLTQSTFTLEQPLGQFSSHNISDWDTIWLVVALSNATQSFTAPQTNQDISAPANFSQRGYYLTLRANRGLYQGDQARGQLHVLRVGNDTHCQPTKIGCNHPLPGPGPYNSCRSTSLSGPEETGSVRRYTTHHTFSTPAEGAS